MEIMEYYLLKADLILFFIMIVSVGYLFVFAFFSMWGGKKKYPTAIKRYRFVVFIPAYKEDKVIADAVDSLLEQDYPKNLVDIVVISDKMEESTNEMLSKLPIKLFFINTERSSKAYALNYAVEILKDEKYDIVVIMDADNIVNQNFLSEINDAFYSGATALQAHRTAKNINNDMAILDAISEEINNSIFRKGHVNMGLSSALIGSGMAFEFPWFKEAVQKLSTAGEDKELERLLLKEEIFIDYLEHVMVYDEKTQKVGTFFNQRRRWLASQFGILSTSIKDFPKAIFTRNIDYIDKIFQWMLLPRVVLLGIISILSVTISLIDLRSSLKWWALLVTLILAFIMAVPDFMVNRRTIRAIRIIPLIFLLMILNFFRLKGVNKKFIHTKKEG